MEIVELKPYGYCYGVKRAIELIKEVRNSHLDKNIYVFGMLVHNNDVVKYLNELGIITIDISKIDKIQRLKEFTSDDIVVFTAHGHDKSYEEILKLNNVTFYDATCKNVEHNLKLIRSLSKENQIIFIGKKSHPETEASLSISSNVILYDLKEKIDYAKITSLTPYIVNQTTLSFLETKSIHLEILEKYPNAKIVDEICSQTRIRQQNIISTSFNGDLVLIVGSVHSSNTDKLYMLSKDKYKNSKVIKVENLEDLKKHNLDGIKSCLITSGTSTPLEAILEIKEYLGGINNE